MVAPRSVFELAQLAATVAAGRLASTEFNETSGPSDYKVFAENCVDLAASIFDASLQVMTDGFEVDVDDSGVVIHPSK